MKRNIIAACLIVALLEGFAGLGIEIYAIRISATYIGSSISITGVILAMVLIAIAVGYWYGGKVSQNTKTPRQSLLRAGKVLAISAMCHGFACIAQLPLLALMSLLTTNPMISAVAVGMLYGVGLAFGSTSIPLITQFLTLQYESDDNVDAGKNAGMMVAITTIGSVLGSTVTPILLLPYIGLMSSLALFIVALSASALLCTKLASYASDTEQNLAKTKVSGPLSNYLIVFFAFLVTFGFIVINRVDTGYQTAANAWFIKNINYEGAKAVIITDKPGQSTSSCWIYETKKNCHLYGVAAVDAVQQLSAEKLVFLGGAGMAIPSEIAIAHPEKDITVIDIDKGLPEIIEKHFLKAPLAKNIDFIGNDARGFFASSDATYDFMFIDAFQGEHVASNLFTLEALERFNQSSTNIMANIIGRAKKDDGYTQTLLHNWQMVFNDDAYILTSANDEGLQNMLLCNFACGQSQKLSQIDFIAQDQKAHTDDVPRLDRYYYQSL